jgi:hypothetical protein
MASITLLTQTASDKDYITQFNSNWATIQAAVNDLDAQIFALFGDGALLLLDWFDRDGIVGAASFQLDIINYAGGSNLTVGRRPVFDALLGEKDESIAFITVGGTRTRVVQTADLSLNAAAIVVSVPTTIFIGVGSSGNAQLFPDQVAANVLYMYSLTWDGFTMKDFRRLAPIMGGYTLLQEMNKAPRTIQLFDSDTDWLVDVKSRTEIVLPGIADDNEIDLEAPMQVIGGFVTFHRGDFDGCHAPTGGAPDNQLKLKLTSAAVKWNLGEITIDCSQIPDTIFFKIDEPVVGDLRFVNEVTRFDLELVSIGSAVVSARGMTWGLYVKPIIGTAIAKDETVLSEI